MCHFLSLSIRNTYIFMEENKNKGREMPAAEQTVKGPPDLDEIDKEEAAELKTGKFTSGEYATWFGNALVLASIGTIALLVASPPSRGITIISDILISTSLGVLVWSSYKYFCAGQPKRHWTSYLFLLFFATTLAALVWLAIVV
jgi:hypothetical protein